MVRSVRIPSGRGLLLRAALLPVCAFAAVASMLGCADKGKMSMPAWLTLSPKPAASQSSSQMVASQDNPFTVQLAPGSPVVASGTSQMAVQFRVMQVQAPLGVFSRSQKIWDHLDEHAVGIEMQMLLQRNGLRLGLGASESWPPVKAILESIERRTVRHLPPSLPNSLSVSLQLTGEPVNQTLFFYRADGSMAGNYYSQATDVLRILWDFSSDNIEQVVVYITPEIRQDQTGVVYKATPLGAAAVPIFEGRVFSELTGRLVVAPQGYIVLGPGSDVNHTGLLGREFLVNQIDGEPYESILVIVPEVLDLRKQPAKEDMKAAVQEK